MGKKRLNLMFKRKEAGLTQQQLGEKVGVKGKTIYTYESGERNPSIKTLLKIAEVLGCSIDEIA